MKTKKPDPILDEYSEAAAQQSRARGSRPPTPPEPKQQTMYDPRLREPRVMRYAPGQDPESRRIARLRLERIQREAEHWKAELQQDLQKKIKKGPHS